MTDPSFFGEGNRYRVSSRLGEGGMGVVYRARDTVLKRDVAIKVMARGLEESAEGLARTIREAKLLATLSHPNLVPVFEADLRARPPFIVQELLQGEDLAEHLVGGALDAAGTRRLLLHLAEVLAYLHEHRVIHRDLKPQNVFVESSGTFRLMDFGLARDLERTRLTCDHAMLGTMLYQPPEFFQGAEAGEVTDVYQAGLVVHEAGTGVLLHPQANSVTELMEKMRDPARHFRPHWDELPPDVATVVKACCSPRPQDRPPDGGALLRLVRGDRDPVRTVRRPRNDGTTLRTATAPSANATGRRSGSRPFIALGLLGVVVALLLALRPSPTIGFDITALRLNPSARTAKVTWTSTDPYPSVVEVAGSPPRTVTGTVTPGSPAWHLVAVDGLPPGREFVVHVILPDGSRSMPLRGATRPVVATLLEAIEENGVVRLTLEAPPLRGGTLRIMADGRQVDQVPLQVVSPPGALPARLDCLLANLPQETTDLVLSGTLPDGSPLALSLRGSLGDDVARLSERVATFDPAPITVGLLETGGPELVRAFTAAAPGNHSGQSVASWRNAVNAALMTKLDAHPRWLDVQRAIGLSRVALGTSVLPPPGRQRFVASLQPALALHLYGIYVKALDALPPGLALGEFAQSLTSSLRATETLMLFDGSLSRPLRFGAGAATIINAPDARTTWTGTVTIPPGPPIRKAELRFDGRPFFALALGVRVGTGPTLLTWDRPMTGRTGDDGRPRFLRIPSYLLSEGQNTVTVTLPPLFDYVTDRTAAIDRMTLLVDRTAPD